MDNKNLAQYTAVAERMTAKIDDLYDRLNTIENLIADLSPGFSKISKEISPTVKDLRELYEREETITLIKKTGENIPTFITILELMETIKEMVEDLTPAVGKISKEVTPNISILREALEKDEVFDLLKKTGENINPFNKLLDFLAAFDKNGILDFTLENIAAKETNIMIRGMQATVSKTMIQFMENPPKPGLKNIFNAIKDPEVQKGILFLTAFAKNLSQCMSDACMYKSQE